MTGLALLLATSILPGFRIDTTHPGWWMSLIRLPLIFTVLMILLRPLLLFLTLPLNVVTLGLADPAVQRPDPLPQRHVRPPPSRSPTTARPWWGPWS